MLDAVVVGAGPNGLVAANLLADAGWSVEVLEAQSRPGGAVRSDRGVHPDYVSDMFSAFYPLAAASPVIRDMDLHAEGLRWAHAPSALAHPLPDGRCAVLERSTEATAKELDAFAEGDGAAWTRMCGTWDRISTQLLDALFTPFPRSGQGPAWQGGCVARPASPGPVPRAARPQARRGGVPR